MTTTELDDLLEAVEAARKKLHPELPAELLREVVLVEEANAGADQRAIAEIRKVVEKHIERREKRDARSGTT